MNAVISCSLKDFARVLEKAKDYIQLKSLQEKLDFNNDKQELVRECLADENYFTIQHMLNFTPKQLQTVLKAVSHIIGVDIDDIAFVNKFDSDGAACAVVHLTTTIIIR